MHTTLRHIHIVGLTSQGVTANQNANRKRAPSAKHRQEMRMMAVKWNKTPSGLELKPEYCPENLRVELYLVYENKYNARITHTGTNRSIIMRAGKGLPTAKKLALATIQGEFWQKHLSQ